MGRIIFIIHKDRTELADGAPTAELVGKPSYSHDLTNSGSVLTAPAALQVEDYHGCKTGDCPHEKQDDCDLDLAAHSFAVNWTKPRLPEAEMAALEHAFKVGAAWNSRSGVQKDE